MLFFFFSWTKKAITLKPSLWEIGLDMSLLHRHRQSQSPPDSLGSVPSRSVLTVMCVSSCLCSFIKARETSEHACISLLFVFVPADAAGIGMPWFTAQGKHTNTQNLLTSIAASPTPSHVPHSPRILSYLAGWGSVPLKMIPLKMELNIPSNVWILCTLRCTVQFSQILSHKINCSRFGDQQIFEFHLTF